MRSAFLLCFVFLFGTMGATAQQKSLELRRTAQPIVLDGRIDAAWAKADSVADFVQQSPFYNAAPSHRTVAKALTSESALYCLIIAYAPREEISAYTGYLDNAGGDFVSIMLDTFGDKKSAYKLAVYAGGARSDARLLDDGRNRDYSWDGVWFAETRVEDWGYVVEMEIPYRSIQYDENLESWGLDFDRWIVEGAEDIYWNTYAEAEGQRISKFGRLEFTEYNPTVQGLNLEIYPVAIAETKYVRDGVYDVSPNAGVDLFYNPSPRLTLQVTGNPDFAQIEADPFDFNISRYESYFEERRPFFTEGKEIFMASGKQQNMGFYTPLELFYSRRIGRKLPDGQEVPLHFGAKAFGRAGTWEYGGFSAVTGEVAYDDDGEQRTEQAARFASGRLKRQLFHNSDIGVLFVGKWTNTGSNGVIDIDGAVRGSGWQLAYQFARSFRDGDGDFAASLGFTNPSENWLSAVRGRTIGNDFNIDEVGYVPWQGTAEIIGFTGPRWYFPEGTISQILMYGGAGASYEHVDLYTDVLGLLGYNMQFRSNCGGEINLTFGRSKEKEQEFDSYEASLSTWFHTNPVWEANIWGGYSRTYNFDRDWLAYYSWVGAWAGLHASNILYFELDAGQWIEGNPDGGIEDITWNARPSATITPINDLSFRLYVDNVFVRSSNRMEQIIVGFLVSWNFLPKSWMYFAINDVRDRSERRDGSGLLLPTRMHIVDQAAVLKVKYLYYF
ncbi:carbohydrate binding family 9 domain-containing protein [bacterium]|nr:carbohydrate binding family 9 domain-containing protein [bacterium]